MPEGKDMRAPALGSSICIGYSNRLLLPTLGQEAAAVSRGSKKCKPFEMVVHTKFTLRNGSPHRCLQYNVRGTIPTFPSAGQGGVAVLVNNGGI